jgi:hypothetical protein
MASSARSATSSLHQRTRPRYGRCCSDGEADPADNDRGVAAQHRQPSAFGSGVFF